MEKFLRVCVVALVMMAIASCGGGGRSSTVFVAQILSDQPTDGDIGFDPVRQALIITNGPATVFFGIDDLDPNFPEYRGFLDFPLDGSTGGDVIPIDAAIVSATLELFLNEVSFATVVPTLLDLVPYPISGLTPQDFNTLPFASQRFDLFRSDQGRTVAIDVTPLMREAQRRGLPDFQVRLLLDLVVSDIGFVGVEDRPNVTATAPLLTVAYE